MEIDPEEKSIRDQLFCLSFENKTLSDLVVYNHAERWVYGFMYPIYEKEHLNRYSFAKNYVQNKNVLDIACGCGYGSYLLAKEGRANQITGVDINEESIKYGKIKYPHSKISRICGDATSITFDKKFDVIISFETIEHIPEYEKFLINIEKSLDKDGTFIISTPIVLKTWTTPYNPHHVIEWSLNDFQDLIKKYFNIIDIYVQVIKLISDIQKENLTFYKRVLRKLKIKKYKQREIIPFEKFNNQYIPSQIVQGYQVLVCNKKNN